MEVFSLFGTLGLRGASDVKAQLQETSKQADNTAKTFDNSTERTGKSSQSLLAKIGAGFTQAGNVAGQFVAGSIRAIGNFGQSLENQGQKMINFGGGAKTALATVGLSLGTLGMSITAGMKRLDALNGANLVFQSMGAAADTSFGGISKAAKDMTKGTVMSVGDFNSKVQQYIAKGVPQAAAIATTALNAFVKGTSVGMTDATTATARFNSVGMDLNKSTTEFKNMTKVLAGTGNATAEGIDRASLAISQMAGKGKLDMGNMLQLMNTMPNALAFVSQSTGISMKDIQQAISDGKVSYEDFSKALQDQSVKVDEQFAKQGGVMAQTGKTFEGSISNMKAAVARFGASILEGIGQSKITDAMANIGSKIDETAAKITPIIPKVVDFGTKLFNLAQKFAPVIGAFLAFKLGALGVGTVMKQVGSIFTTFAKNPILSMLMLLAMWIAQNYAKSEEFRKKVDDLLTSLQPLVKVVQDVGSKFKSFIDWMNKGSAGAQVVKAAIVRIVTAIATFTILNTVAGWIAKVKTAFALLNATFAASGIGLIIIAISALVAGLIYFFTQTTTGKQLWQDFINWLKNAWQGISSFFSGLWNGIVQIFNTTVTAIHDFVVPIFNTIASGIQIAMNLIWSVIQIAWQLIKVTIEFVVGGIIAYIKFGFNTLVSIIQFVMNIIKSVITTVWNFISPFIMGVVNGIKNAISIAWNAISSIISSVMNAIKSFIVPIWNSIKAVISSVMNAIKSVISSIWNSIKSVVSSVLNTIKNTVTSIFNAIKATVTSIWNGIKNAISNAVNGAKSVVTSVFNAIKGTISSVVNSIKSTVSSVFNAIKSAMESPIRGAKSVISGIINTIKGLFNFKISFPKIEIPKIPMPHFKISGDFNPLKGKIPSVGVDWYAKGGIMTGATVFGMNGNNLQVGGEAGREAVIPLNKETLGQIGDGIKKSTSGMNDDAFTFNQYNYSPENIDARTASKYAKRDGKDMLRTLRIRSN